MGTENTSDSASESIQCSINDHNNDNCCSETQVVLNVYDLTPLNHYTSFFGFGIFHSGIEVHGMEYGFGAHDFPMSGVFEVEPKSCPGFIYRCSIPLGHIETSPAEFRTFIEDVASEYHGDTYHLISKNCNHFSDDMAFRLTGQRIPGWVNRLAKLGSVCSCLLPESLQVTTVKQLPEYHACADEEETGSTASTLHDQTAETDEAAEQDNKHLLSPTTSGVSEVAFIRERLQNHDNDHNNHDDHNDDVDGGDETRERCEDEKKS